MFSNIVESILRNAGADVLTEAFILAMIGVFLLALVLHKLGFWTAFTSYTATLLTSLGILGTFAGVVTGLLDFDASTEQIDHSIGLLLQGLKTAFTSSLVGMTLSIFYKVLVLVPALAPPEESQIDGEITVESLFEVASEQAHYLRGIATAMAGKEGSSVLKQLKYLCDSFEWLQQNIESNEDERKDFKVKTLELHERTLKALSDDGESSLTGQLKLARSDANDIGKAITSQLEAANNSQKEEFAAARISSLEQMRVFESSFTQLETLRLDTASSSSDANRQRAEMLELLERSPTETLIAALEDVIRDFNKHISEQFGENFKELNLAVGRMIDWQENYRAQIETLQKSFESSAQSIGNCEISIGSIEKSSESIPQNMGQLSEIMEVSRHQLNELEGHLQAFAEVKERAVESVPILNEVVEDVVRKVASSTNEMIASCEEGNRNFQSSVASSVSSLSQSAGSFMSQLENTVKQTESELNVMLDGLRRSIEVQFENSTDSVEKLIDTEFKNMEEARRTQTENVMQEMGAALTSITGQFARDYTSLVRAMQNVVETGQHRGN